jgi:hypothetical protein
MRKFHIFALAAMVVFASGSVSAQRTEITISLTEQFFDTVVDAIFIHTQPPEFSIGSNTFSDLDDGFVTTASLHSREADVCRDSIRLRREMDGVKTSVRFRDGMIIAPLAFTGNYNPPFVGCVEFSGWAESVIDIQFDAAGQRLIAYAKVLNVSLNGTRGVAGNLIARMVQSSIDKRVNPIEIFRMDKVSFMLPVQNSGNLSMRAIAARHELRNGAIDIHITYEFAAG